MGAALARHEKPKIYDRKADDLPTRVVPVVDLVDDPLEPGAKLEVIRNILTDPLGAMFRRGEIDNAQFQAGKDWQEHWEAAEIGGARAIDPTREAVDGGRFKEPEIDNRSRAMKELKAAHAAVGEYEWSLLFDVLARHMTFAAIAQARMMNDRQYRGLSERFRGSLETLAKLWKYA